ncbi:MAG: fructose-bisphosphate aldolase, class [Pseudonocardiales bacterium]|jgi:fructose-bisphosphate aldolase class II|nr:fructose-bisphosphate aldolase, class [Pseudonocardiales bacterium]
MPLVPTHDLVAAASRRRSAVAAFNVITLEHAEAIVAGAVSAGVGVILQISQNAVAFHDGNVLPIAAAASAVATESAAAVALHLDHVDDEQLLRHAGDAGFSSVMFDAGALPYVDNVERTRAAAEWAHAAGLWVEAELGYVGGKPDAPRSAHAAGVRTDPDEAAAFVAATGVDALAVAVGSSHAMTMRTATLDTALVSAIAAAVPVPLVLHGSSGVAEDDLRAAVRAGIAKVNVGTALNIALTDAIRGVLAADDSLVDPRKYLAPGRAAMTEAVAAVLAAIS